MTPQWCGGLEILSMTHASVKQLQSKFCFAGYNKHGYIIDMVTYRKEPNVSKLEYWLVQDQSPVSADKFSKICSWAS
jgi:hypothetical protein